MWCNKFLKTISLTVFVSICTGTLLYNTDSEAAQKVKAEGKDIVKEDKAMIGKVVYYNSQFISIIDKKDEDEESDREKLLYLDEDVEVIGKNSLSEIKPGDTVQIQFEKITRTLKDVRRSKKVVTSVKFLRAAETKKSSLKSGKK